MLQLFLCSIIIICRFIFVQYQNIHRQFKSNWAEMIFNFSLSKLCVIAQPFIQDSYHSLNTKNRVTFSWNQLKLNFNLLNIYITFSTRFKSPIKNQVSNNKLMGAFGFFFFSITAYLCNNVQLTSLEFTAIYAIGAYRHSRCEFNPRSGEVYSIQHYVIKFVSDLWQVGCFLQVLLFPLPIKLIATI